MITINLYLISEKGLEVLKHIIQKKYHKDVANVNVIVGKDKNVEEDYSEMIIEVCMVHGLKYFLRNEIIKSADYSIAISWRWMLSIPNLIVIHDSILPTYRGFAPLVNCLKNGERQIGACAQS